MKKVKCTTKLELADKLEQQKATKQKDPSIYVSSQVAKSGLIDHPNPI